MLAARKQLTKLPTTYPNIFNGAPIKRRYHFPIGENNMSQTLDMVFALFGLVILTLALFGFYWHISQSHKDRAVKREIALRFYPDKQGNYPKAIFSDGSLIEFSAGNSSTLATPTYIIQPHKSEVIAALPNRPEVTIYSNGSEVESTSQPQTFGSKDEVLAYLIDAKNRGQSLTSTLKSLGITGGESFKAYSKKWKALP